MQEIVVVNVFRAQIRKCYRFVVRWMAIHGNVEYSPDLYVGRRTNIAAPDKLTIGRHVKIGTDTWIAVNGTIEDGVQISSYVGIVGKADHLIGRIGQRPFSAPFIWDKGYKERDARHFIRIERDVWIGYKATVLSGLTVGRGAVIAAGAVVTKDVEPYSIVAGNPARKIGMLFSSSEIEEHEKIIGGGR